MSRKIVKLKFVDVYPGFVPEASALYKAIAQSFDIRLCDDPDYIITQPYGHGHLKYNCIKILFTGENMTPDFNLYDYAIGFDYLSFDDRYVRVPLWAIRQNFRDFHTDKCPADDELLNRSFCSFVVSNGAGNPLRTKFFSELSKYKKVDSGGCHLNNVGGPVKDKLSFISRYKFNIAFENSAYPGYTTEKIIEPFLTHTVPIYWGDPLVERDFNPQSFICLKSEDDIEKAIEEIIRLDKDEAAYLEMCKMPCLVNPDRDFYWNKMVCFLSNIFEQPLEKARRLAQHGYQEAFYRTKYKKAFAAYDFANMPLNLYRKVRKAIRGL